MRHEDWAARLTDTIAEQVRRLRTARGLTAQQVVDAVNALGLPMKRSVLTNLEHGRRGNVTIAELLVLAKVLDVPPIELVFPVGRAPEVEALSGRSVDTWQAARWFTGEGKLPLGDGTEGHVLDGSDLRRDQRATAVTLFREHSQRESEWWRSYNAYRRALAAGDDLERDAYEKALHATEALLAELRSRMRTDGLTPPALGSPAMSHIDEDQR